MDGRGEFFADVAAPISFRGLESVDPLSFKVYDPERVVLGKRLRPAAMRPPG